MKKKKKKGRLTWDELEANYNDFIKRKELKPDGKELFETIIKKASKVKRSSAK